MGVGSPIEYQDALQRLFAALCMGLFIGLEREFSQSAKGEEVPAGLRTYGLIGLLGGVSAYLSMSLGPWALGVAFLGLSAVTVTAYIEARELRSQQHETGGIGVTSEVAGLLVFALGALAMEGHTKVAGTCAVLVAVVLSAKKPLHDLVKALGQQDMVATMKFAVITFIILPILPNTPFGPYDAFNAHKTWMLVILISGISFLGYVLSKLIGADKGIPLSGFVGGLVSSTAVTVSSAKRSKTAEALSEPLALGIVLACAVMVPRVALVVGAINGPLALHMWPTYVAMLLASVVNIYVVYRIMKRHPVVEGEHQTEQTNPFELQPALKFALVFAVITFLVRAAQSAGATGGIYAVSALSGLIDADAAAVSLAEQAKAGAGSLPIHVAAQGVALAMIVNSLVKAFLAWSLGSRLTGKLVITAMVVVAVVGTVIAFSLT